MCVKMYKYFAIILWFLVNISKEEETEFDFLIKGEEVRIATQVRSERVSIIIGINIDIVNVKQLELEIETLMKKWENYPPFQAEITLAQVYFGLTEGGVPKLVAVAKMIEKILAYKDDLSVYTPEYSCIYNYSSLNIKNMQQDVKNLENAFNRIGNAWTVYSVQTDNTEINTIRTFAGLFLEVMDGWYDEAIRVLSELDSLASEDFPSSLMGHYQEAPCIKNITGEKVQVLECNRAKDAYICNIEVKIPEIVNNMHLLLPAHYNDIRIRGNNKDQIFATTVSNPEPKILDCNHYDMHAIEIPVCQVMSIGDICLSKLQGNSITDIINNCNFTKDETDVGIRTDSKGLLVQGIKVTAKIKDGTGYKTLTTETPVLIFTDKEVVLVKDEDEFIFPTISNSSGTRVVKSKLTDKDKERLNARYEWEIFWENFDYEDIVRYLILVLQVVMYPVVIVSIGLGIRARKNLQQLGFSSHKKNPQKQIYKKNKMLLKNLK